MRPDNVTRDVKIRMKELGIPAETRLHDLRGSFISLLIEENAGIRTVMEIVGHKDPRTTLKAYARSHTKAKEDAIKSFSKGLERAKKESRKEKKQG